MLRPLMYKGGEPRRVSHPVNRSKSATDGKATRVPLPAANTAHSPGTRSDYLANRCSIRLSSPAWLDDRVAMKTVSSPETVPTICGKPA